MPIVEIILIYIKNKMDLVIVYIIYLQIFTPDIKSIGFSHFYYPEIYDCTFPTFPYTKNSGTQKYAGLFSLFAGRSISTPIF